MLISMRETVMGKVESNEVETSVQSSVLTNLKEQLLRNPCSHNQAITSSTGDQEKSGNDEMRQTWHSRGGRDCVCKLPLVLLLFWGGISP